MLRLTIHQAEVFRMNALTKAKLRAVEFVKLNFGKEMGDRKDTAPEVVDRVYEFCALYGIHNELNIQRMIAWEYKYGFIDKEPIPLKWLEILDFPERDEEVKVKYFQKHVMNLSKNQT